MRSGELPPSGVQFTAAAGPGLPVRPAWPVGPAIPASPGSTSQVEGMGFSDAITFHLAARVQRGSVRPGGPTRDFRGRRLHTDQRRSCSRVSKRVRIRANPCDSHLVEGSAGAGRSHSPQPRAPGRHQVACCMCPRVGARSGARARRPRWLRIRSITGASRMAAMIFSSPPQFGQCSRSISKRSFSEDQLVPKLRRSQRRA